jgi:hypothetical protein
VKVKVPIESSSGGTAAPEVFRILFI